MPPDVHVVVPWSRQWAAESIAVNLRQELCTTSVVAVRVGHRDPAPWADHVVDASCVSAGQARNLGLAVLSNIGATGPVAFFDDDDHYGPGYLREALDALEGHPEADWLTKYMHVVRDVETDRVYLIDPQFADCPTTQAMGGTIVHRDVRTCPTFGSMPIGEDTDWGYRAGRGWKTGVGHFIYRIHPGQTSRITASLLLNGAAEDPWYLGPWSAVGWPRPSYDGIATLPMLRLKRDPEQVYAWMRQQSQRGRWLLEDGKWTWSADST